MDDKDMRMVMTSIDWGTAYTAVLMFLSQDKLPAGMDDHQLDVLQRRVAGTRQRLREQGGG